MAIYQYPLKIDKELIDKLRAIADNNSRSLNKEIEFIIKHNMKAFHISTITS